MNSRSAAELAFGVAGVWLIASRIPDLVASLTFLTRSHERWFGVVHITLVIACGLALAAGRHRLASWLVPVPEALAYGSASGLQAAAFSVVGIALLASGVAKVLGELALSAEVRQHPSILWLATPVAQIAVGLGLFLGGGGLVRLWQLGRNAGLPPEDPPGQRPMSR